MGLHMKRNFAGMVSDAASLSENDILADSVSSTKSVLVFFFSFPPCSGLVSRIYCKIPLRFVDQRALKSFNPASFWK